MCLIYAHQNDHMHIIYHKNLQNINNELRIYKISVAQKTKIIKVSYQIQPDIFQPNPLKVLSYQIRILMLLILISMSSTNLHINYLM